MYDPDKKYSISDLENLSLEDLLALYKEAKQVANTCPRKKVRKVTKDIETIRRLLTG